MCPTTVSCCIVLYRTRIVIFSRYIPYVATADNMADFFTKSLPALTFFSMRNKIMNVSPEDALAAPSKSHGLALKAMAARAMRAPCHVHC